MDKNYFNALSKPARIRCLVNEGEAINELNLEHAYTSLFLLNDFYVEVFLDKASNEITHIAVLENTEILFEYIRHLSLNALIAVNK